MKKIILAAGFFGVMTSMAQAQTSVTIYGIVDLGMNYTNSVGGSSLLEMASGYGSGSRLGFKGIEDLGGGLSALFQLENGFNTSNGKIGQGGRLFGRQAYVGLKSNSWGTLTFGRQYDVLGDYPGAFVANNSWGGTLFTHPFDNDTSGSFRLENAIKYASPKFSGVTFGSAVGLGGQAGSIAQNSTYSVGARYENGPLSLAAGYINLNHPGMKNGVPVDVDSGSISNADTNFVSDQQKTYGLGAGYVFGAATINLSYFHTKVINPFGLQSFPNQTTNIDPYLQSLSSIQFNNIELNALYQLTPTVSLGGMYTYTQGKAKTADGSSVVKPVWHMLGAMADYQFSKRTDVYTHVAYQRRTGDSTGTGLDNAHIAGTQDTSSTNKQAVIRVGLRHKF